MIKNVEWAKFNGDYNPHEDGPSFECLENRDCQVNSVKTDSLTTIHPRPAVQSYINMRAPSYSVTFHDVSRDQLGFYRCSATRQVGDRRELVYRIVPLE